MPDQYPLTPKAVNAIVVLTFAIISILLARAPKLSEAWASLDGNTKRYAFLGMYLVAAISVMAIQCGGSGQACIQNNLWQAVNVGITAWLSSQGAFLFFGKKPSGGEKSQ